MQVQSWWKPFPGCPQGYAPHTNCPSPGDSRNHRHTTHAFTVASYGEAGAALGGSRSLQSVFGWPVPRSSWEAGSAHLVRGVPWAQHLLVFGVVHPGLVARMPGAQPGGPQGAPAAVTRWAMPDGLGGQETASARVGVPAAVLTRPLLVSPGRRGGAGRRSTERPQHGFLCRRASRGPVS